MLTLALPIIAALSGPIPVQTHADCFTRKPNGNIVLHSCKANRMLRERAKANQQHPRRKILVVPTGRELDI